MRKIRSLLLSCLLLSSQVAFAELPTPNAVPRPSLPGRPIPEAPVIPAPPVVEARAYLLADHNSGQILVEKGIDTRVEPASLTKIMSAYVIYDMMKAGKFKRSDMVTISERAWKMEGSRMFAKVGSQLPADDLLKGMIIQSGNDSTVAMAEFAAGSEESFVSLMNQYAQRLGMNETHFTDSTGMPDNNHYTTARDMLKLTTALIRDFPEEYKEYSQKEYTHNGIKQTNRNRLLWLDSSVDGVKTGHTESSGFSLVVSSLRDGMRLISVVIGSDSDKSRTQGSLALVSYGYRFFETRKLYPADQPIQQARVWKGAASEVGLGVGRDMYVTFPRGKYEELKISLDRPRVIEAPIADGQHLGQVKVAWNDQALMSEPLVAKKAVERGGIVRRLIDNVLMMFE